MKNKAKKKLIPISLVSVLLTPFLLTACYSTKSVQNNSTTSVNNDRLSFATQPTTKAFLEDFFNKNNELLNNELFIQQSISDQKLVELKYTLKSFHPTRTIIEDGSAMALVAGVSKQVLLDDVTTNWYWMLNNIDLFDYLFNPYNTNNYKKYDNEKADFNAPINELSIRLKKEINQFYKISKKANPYDHFENTTVYYLLFNDKYVLRIHRFKEDRALKARVDFHIYELMNKQTDLITFANQFESTLDKIQNEQLANQLKNIEDPSETSQQEYEREKKFYTEQYNDYSKYNIYSNDVYLFLEDKVYNQLKADLKLRRFTLRNVDNKVLKPADLIKFNEINQQFTKPHQQYLKFINKDELINIKDFDTKAFVTDKIIQRLLKIAYENPVDALHFVNQQKDPNHIALIKAQLLDYRTKFINPQNNKVKVDPNLLAQYANFLSANWYFVLTNLNLFEGLFYELYQLPTKTTIENQQEVLLSPSQQYKEAIEKRISRGYEQRVVNINNYLEQVQEGDSSRGFLGHSDYYIKKQKEIFNIRFSKEDNKIKTIFNPLVYYFPQAKVQLSINTITTIFHHAIYHHSKAAYDGFEDLVFKFGYGIPQMMLLLIKKENG